ncbi:unnamed protein product [Ambrosiozyma monospora]|uniref:Unnamed protein product n=1 Tax=Ambrosiozyma monospora TaxID=43982 RepID=A0ACB5TP85_AMBMO|nr:unnamed protein product [Ambrosiozyma monospora]
MKKLLNRKDKRRSLTERERALANANSNGSSSNSNNNTSSTSTSNNNNNLLTDHYNNETDYSKLRRPSAISLGPPNTPEYSHPPHSVGHLNTPTNSGFNNSNTSVNNNASTSNGAGNVGNSISINITNSPVPKPAPDLVKSGKPVSNILKTLHVNKSSSSLQSSSNSNMISHEQAQSLQALVDPGWDQQVLKSGWVNKIDENDGNTEPELRFLRAELKGSMFYLYRPPQELQQVKHFEPENEKQTASPNDSSEFLPLARMATQNPSRNDLDHDKSRRPTIPELDPDMQSRKTSQSSFTLAYDQDDNRSLRSRTAISVNLREFPEFDNSSFTMDELSYASDAYPHPDLVLDEDIGMILTVD